MSIYEKIKSDIAQPYYIEQYPNDGPRFVAWYLRNIYRLDPVQAAGCITDGPNDKQIDAVYIDDQEQTVHILQGKFYGSSSVDTTPFREILSSWMQMKDLPALQENANDKLKAKITEIATAIEDDYQICFELLITSKLTEDAQNDFNLFARQILEDSTLNATIVLVDLEMLQHKFDEALNHDTPYINYDFHIDNDKMLQMILGKTKAAIAVLPLRDCLSVPGIRDGSLFRKNVRQSLGTNKVNKNIAETIKTEPSEFFFLHNGITAICSEMNYADGILSVKGLNVVNGCQSLNTILKCSELVKQADDAYIMFRFYEISDINRADNISTSTNSQTTVKARDLRSNDKYVIALKRAYEHRYPDGYFATKRGEKPSTAKYNAAHIVYLTDLGKELIAWHSQRPTNSYSETKVFDNFFNQLFHRSYAPENIQALSELHKAVLPYWESEKLDENLISIKAYGPYHHMFAMSMIFCKLNKITEGVPSPSCALQKLKDSNLMDEVINLALQSISMALQAAAAEAAEAKRPLSTPNWSKNKNCLTEIREQINASLTPHIMWPGSAEKIAIWTEALQLPADAFEPRWAAD